MPHRVSNTDMLERAHREHITAEELDIVVSGSQNSGNKRQHNVDELQDKLDAIEDQIADKLPPK